MRTRNKKYENKEWGIWEQGIRNIRTKNKEYENKE